MLKRLGIAVICLGLFCLLLYFVPSEILPSYIMRQREHRTKKDVLIYLATSFHGGSWPNISCILEKVGMVLLSTDYL